jgi:hypothetical protein
MRPSRPPLIAPISEMLLTHGYGLRQLAMKVCAELWSSFVCPLSADKRNSHFSRGQPYQDVGVSAARFFSLAIAEVSFS